MPGEQSSTISPASRWLKALKRRPTSFSGVSAIVANTGSTDEGGRAYRSLNRSGDREDRHVVIELVGREGAQCAFEPLYGPGGVTGAGKLGPQAVLAKAPCLTLSLDDAV